MHPLASNEEHVHNEPQNGGVGRDLQRSLGPALVQAGLCDAAVDDVLLEPEG